MKGNILVGVLVIGVLAVLGWSFRPKAPVVVNTNVVSTTTPASYAKINGKTFSLIVADTPELREKGLSGRDSLPLDAGMFFVFETPDTYAFWMKDMKFPIDIIWLDENFKVVHIASNVAPETYPDEAFAPEENSLYVLETNANIALENNLKVGDVIEVDLKK